MRKKALKALSATALSLALAVAALPGTAQAAYTAECNHDVLYYSHDDVSYEEANSEFHWVYREKVYECGDCGVYVSISEEVGYECHDSWVYCDGDWVCSDCGYRETPGM